MNEVTITLPVETIQLALTALDELPHKKVRSHIDLIVQKTNSAIADAQRAAESNEAVPAGE